MFYGYHYECVDGFNGTNCDKRLIFVNRNRRNDSNHSLAAQEHKTVLIISKKKKKRLNDHPFSPISRNATLVSIKIMEATV